MTCNFCDLKSRLCTVSPTIVIVLGSRQGDLLLFHTSVVARDSASQVEDGDNGTMRHGYDCVVRNNK